MKPAVDTRSKPNLAPCGNAMAAMALKRVLPRGQAQVLFCKSISSASSRSTAFAHVRGSTRYSSDASKSDPRLKALGRRIEDDYATIRESYGSSPGHLKASSHGKVRANPSSQQHQSYPSSWPTGCWVSPSSRSRATCCRRCTTGGASPTRCGPTASRS